MVEEGGVEARDGRGGAQSERRGDGARRAAREGGVRRGGWGRGGRRWLAREERRGKARAEPECAPRRILQNDRQRQMSILRKGEDARVALARALRRVAADEEVTSARCSPRNGAKRRGTHEPLGRIPSTSTQHPSLYPPRRLDRHLARAHPHRRPPLALDELSAAHLGPNPLRLVRRPESAQHRRAVGAQGAQNVGRDREARRGRVEDEARGEGPCAEAVVGGHGRGGGRSGCWSTSCSSRRARA